MEERPLTKQEKIAQRQHQSTRQLMGIQQLTDHGMIIQGGELIFYLIQPDNLRKGYLIFSADPDA